MTVKCLEFKGVDMSQASIAGSWGMLRAAEMYRDGVGWVQDMMGWKKPDDDGEE